MQVNVLNALQLMSDLTSTSDAVGHHMMLDRLRRWEGESGSVWE